MIEHVRGVGRHPALHQLGELADVHAAPAEPGEHARVTPDKGGVITDVMVIMSPVGVLPVIPGPARSNPDDGGPEVDVQGQRGVLLPILLRDPPTLNRHLESFVVSHSCYEQILGT